MRSITTSAVTYDVDTYACTTLLVYRHTSTHSYEKVCSLPLSINTIRMVQHIIQVSVTCKVIEGINALDDS